MDKDKIIEKVYNDPLGYGSHHNTLKDARKLDPTITLQDIATWKIIIQKEKLNLKVIIHVYQKSHTMSIKLIYFL